jgi:hypothetical protein
MRRPLALALLLLAGPALAETPVAATPAAPKTVAPVTVFPHSDPPKIVSSFPAAGQTVAPGVLVLRITFDQKMDEHAFEVAAAQGGRAPACLKTPRLLADDRTFVLLCTTAPDAAYAMSFNAEPKGGFQSIAGGRAVPAALAFSTSDTIGPRDLEAALKISNLTPNDVPIATQP